MRPWLPLLSVLFITSACTHVRAPEMAPAMIRTEINERAQQATATVEVDDGRRLSAKGLRLDPDTTSWFEPRTGTLVQVPTRRIQAVRFARRGRGALWGLVGGLVAGAAAARLSVGAGMAADDLPDECESLICGIDLSIGVLHENSRRLAIALGGLLGGGLGAGLGAAVGAPLTYHVAAPADMAQPEVRAVGDAHR
jgi:hypothetical protein